MKEMIEDVEMGVGEGDEEDMEWEAEQLRRGGHMDREEKAEEKKRIYKPVPGELTLYTDVRDSILIFKQSQPQRLCHHSVQHSFDYNQPCHNSLPPMPRTQRR